MQKEDVKVGMKVRRTACEFGGLNTGFTATVKELNKGMSGNFMTLDGFGGHEYHPEYFEPAYELEVGCRVRVVDYKEHWDGLEGTVEKFLTGYTIIITTDKYGGLWFNKKNLIVIEPAPKTIELNGMAYSHDYHSGVDWGHYGINSGRRGGKTLMGVCRDSMNEAYKKLVQDSIKKAYDLPQHFDFDFEIRPEESIRTVKKMEDKTELYKSLAKEMNDEYVGGGQGVVYFKKAGEMRIMARRIDVEITQTDIVELLKRKGIADAVPAFVIPEPQTTLAVDMYHAEPVEKPENEAD